MPSLTFTTATSDDAEELAALHCAVAEDLTSRHGRGPWSTNTSEKGVLLAMRQSRVIIARQRDHLIATFRLTTKKPWAIDASYFSACKTPLYLLAMAVEPKLQKTGIGRKCLDEAHRLARDWRADSIRLDAYDAAAGAGGFYAACGYLERGRRTYRGAALIYYEHLLD